MSEANVYAFLKKVTTTWMLLNALKKSDVSILFKGFYCPFIRDLIGSMVVLSPSLHSPFMSYDKYFK